MRTPVATLLLWAVSVLLYAAFYLQKWQSKPPSPELYTNSLEFQIFNFSISRVPPLLVLLLAVLAIEFFVHHIIKIELPPRSRGLLYLSLVLVTVSVAAYGVLGSILTSTHIFGNPWTYSLEFQLLDFMLRGLPIAFLVCSPLLAAEYYALRRFIGRRPIL